MATHGFRYPVSWRAAWGPALMCAVLFSSATCGFKAPEDLSFRGDKLVLAKKDKVLTSDIYAYALPGETLSSSPRALGIMVTGLDAERTHRAILSRLEVGAKYVIHTEEEGTSACKVYVDNGRKPVLSHHVIGSCGGKRCAIDYTRELSGDAPDKAGATELCADAATTFGELMALHAKLVEG